MDSTRQKEFWEDMWGKEESRNFWTRVDPEVARLAETVSSRQHPNVLDLGCGLGRNAMPFAQAGHVVTAVDVSENAIAYVRARADQLGLAINTRLARFSDDIFAPESFDIVLAVNVLYHGLPADFSRALTHIHCWLRPHGLLYFTCPTLDDGEYGKGTELAPHTFEFEPGHIHFNASWADLESLLSGFCLIWRKKRDHEWQQDGIARVSSRWQVLLERP